MTLNNSSKMSYEEAIDKLSKSVYLESPGIWIDLTDKISDNIFDEMVLFFAAKYNILPVIEHAVENECIDLKLPSQNKEYQNIGQHLISISLQNGNISIHNYIKKSLGENDEIIVEDVDNTLDIEEDISSKASEKETNNQEDTYIPEYLCKNCGSNIFICGYGVSENVVYKFSSTKDRLIENSRESNGNVTCCNCNHKIDDVTSDTLKDLCKLQNCKKCSSNLISVGIIDKSKMKFDNHSKKFIQNHTTFHCGKCDNEISKSQKEFFNLDYK